MVQRLKTFYEQTVINQLISQFEYKNIHEVPKLTKITVNRGLGEACQNAKILEASMKELALITGQKSVLTRAKKAIAGFKLRKNMPIGIMVTLRGDYMYAFLDRLITLALPKIRDFRGLNPKSFDGRGNYNVGLKEQIIFAEINYDTIEHIRGMDISIVTTAKTDQEGFSLLSLLGMPFAQS
uniref:Ribosomal protein L5 n=1 Tax=Glaucocystis incrassata TaxID=1789788 RepID=A0A3G1IVH8_9EUKA|nr:ribosomal protein L5 [Glaucocystis incrassata]ASQ40057.1 ribosomal protein L5 [Glaucocystis incrassata]